MNHDNDGERVDNRVASRASARMAPGLATFARAGTVVLSDEVGGGGYNWQQDVIGV